MTEQRPLEDAGDARLSPTLFMAFCCAYLIADLSIGAMPILFGAFVDERHLALEVVGGIATAETTGLAVGSLLGFVLITRLSIAARTLAAASLAASIAAQIVSAMSVDTLPLMVARLASGTAAAVLQAVAIAWISRLPNPQRPLAIFVGMAFLAGAIGIPLFSWTLESWGLAGTFLFHAGLLVAAMALLPLIPATPPARPDAVTGMADAEATARSDGGRRHWPLLVAIALNFLFNGGVWVYLERVGQWAGFDATRIAALLGLGMFVALASTVALAIVGSRVRTLWPVLCGHMALIIATAALLGIDGWAWFAGAILLFHMGMALLPPAMLAILAIIDPSGRSALQGMVAINIGYAVGPQVYSWVVALYGFTVSLGVAITVFGISLLLFLWVQAGAGRRRDPRIGARRLGGRQ